jgi:hypothetical protein
MNNEINFERPQSEEALAAILRTAYEFALKEQGVRALALCAG